MRPPVPPADAPVHDRIGIRTGLAPDPERLRRFEARSMASPLRLTVPLPDDRRGSGGTAADAAWRAVRAEFAASDQAMSRFREGSDLTRLNRAAGTDRWVEVPRRLERALVAADRAHRSTAGIFDPRVLADLDRLGYRGAALGPAPGDPPAARTAAASSPSRVVRRTAPGLVAVDRPVDLGGIGKGLALRWAAGRIEGRGPTRWLLEAGGDLVARGPGPDGDPWVIGIEDPFGGVAPLAAIELHDGAVATSSVRVHAWLVDGRSVHHLLDPRTGEPADGGLRAVTVLGADPAWAEVWSKTLLIGGRAGIAAAARTRGLAAWWVTDDGDLEMTAAARAATAWVTAEG